MARGCEILTLQSECRIPSILMGVKSLEAAGVPKVSEL